MQPNGPNTRYAIDEESADRYRMFVTSSRYQFISESDVVAMACVQELTRLALYAFVEDQVYDLKGQLHLLKVRISDLESENRDLQKRVAELEQAVR